MNGATRVVQWNVAPWMIWFMYVSMVIALIVFTYGLWLHVRVWRIGKADPRWDQPWKRARRLLVDGFGHRSLLKDTAAGTMHLLIFAGILVLFSATIMVFLDIDLGIPLLHGAFYLVFQSLLVDLFGLGALIGVAIAAYRRYIQRVARLEQGRPADGALLVVLGILLITGFAIEGLRIASTHDQWAMWSPIGAAVGLGLSALIRDDAGLRTAHATMWLFHVAFWHATLALLPFTKLLHLVTSPLNVYFTSLSSGRGMVSTIDFENPPATLGIRSALDLTWKQLLDLDACTECGRCQEVCPAYAEGKPLSPKRVILDLRGAVRAHTRELLQAKMARARGDTARCDEVVSVLPALSGVVIKPETLWACTTCRACEAACPVAIEHVPLILQMRQNLAMEQAELPESLAAAIQSLETRQHPFRGASAARDDWHADLALPTIGEKASAIEVLYWIGCAAALDPRLQRISRAVIEILRAAAVRFAILGPQEQCCGDPGRRTGNEFHFDMQARTNVEILKSYNVKRILTHCPHCLQTLRHDYRAFGADFDVFHHSEFIRELLVANRLPLTKKLDTTIAFHDPCYLGRYNGTFDAPRDVLDKLGTRRLEMARRRERSFCCGAGGGHAFFEDGEGGRINENRAREAIATGAPVVGTACPFCLGMLEAGVSVTRNGREVRVLDIAELVAEAL
jgi:Fe-S oxidoreductase/nitrate reductase gamma subunit